MSKLNFQIGKDKYEIRDITIQDYYDLYSQLFNSDQESGMEIVSKLSSCPMETLNKIKYEDWIALWIAVQNSINETITLDDKFAPKVEVNGVEYGIIDLDSISIGEFSDLDIILNSANAEKRIHEAIAILYRPIVWESGKRYKIEDYENESYKYRVEEFKSFPLSKARIAIAFFLLSENKSLRAMLDSLNTAMENMKDPNLPTELMERISQTQTRLLEVGLKLSLPYQVKTRLGLKKRLDLTFAQLLIGSRGKLMNLKKRILKHKNNK